MKIEIYKGRTLFKGADVGLKSRLYVSGWQLSYELKDIREGYHNSVNSVIAIAMKDGEAVALALGLSRESTPRVELQAFCRKAERRHGFGSACVAAVKKQFSATHYFSAGIGLKQGQSIKFWTTHGIDAW